MPRPPNEITAHPGSPESLLRFVVAANLDRSTATRAEVLRTWRGGRAGSSSSAQAALSRYLSPRGHRIPTHVAEELFAAAERLGSGEQDSLRSFRAFRSRLFPDEGWRFARVDQADSYADLSRIVPRHDAEVFQHGYALLALIRRTKSNPDSWIDLGDTFSLSTRTLVDRILRITTGGGVHAQRAELLLAQLAVERNVWRAIASFLETDPLGCRTVSVLTTILRSAVNLQPESAEEPPHQDLLEAVAQTLKLRSESPPDNESLRTPRGLLVEALSVVCHPRLDLDSDWVVPQLLARAEEGNRSQRERAFTLLVLDKRANEPGDLARVETAVQELLAEADLDPIVRRSVTLHHEVAKQRRGKLNQPGAERLSFYAAADRHAEVTPWSQAGRPYDEIHLLLARGITTQIDRDPLQVPPSVRNAALGLLEASLYDTDAVARRVAIDALRCAGIAEPCARSLGQLIRSHTVRSRPWVRCTALVALGLLQHADDELVLTVAYAAVPPKETPPSPASVESAALLTLGDLLSEMSSGHQDLDGSTVREATENVAKAATWVAPTTEALAHRRHAIAYALSAARFSHPSLPSLDDTLDRLLATDSNDPYLLALVTRAKDQLLDMYALHPDRAIDEKVIYRVDALERAVSKADQNTFTGLARAVAIREEKGFATSPQLFASMIAGTEIGLRRAIALQRNASSHNDSERSSSVRPGAEPNTVDDENQLRLTSMHAEGRARLGGLYEGATSRFGLSPILGFDQTARILSMWSEGVSSQGAGDPSVHDPLYLTRSQLDDLGVSDEEGPWTFFSLVAVLLARMLTKPTARDEPQAT